MRSSEPDLEALLIGSPRSGVLLGSIAVGPAACACLCLGSPSLPLAGCHLELGLHVQDNNEVAGSKDKPAPQA